jgi:hypothetical protein
MWENELLILFECVYSLRDLDILHNKWTLTSVPRACRVLHAALKLGLFTTVDSSQRRGQLNQQSDLNCPEILETRLKLKKIHNQSVQSIRRATDRRGAVSYHAD